MQKIKFLGDKYSLWRLAVLPTTWSSTAYLWESILISFQFSRQQQAGKHYNTDPPTSMYNGDYWVTYRHAWCASIYILRTKCCVYHICWFSWHLWQKMNLHKRRTLFLHDNRLLFLHCILQLRWKRPVLIKWDLCFSTMSLMHLDHKDMTRRWKLGLYLKLKCQ